MNEPLKNPLAEALRQWVEICLLQIEEKKRQKGGVPTREKTDKPDSIEVET